jgi:hypothetical protein
MHANRQGSGDPQADFAPGNGQYRHMDAPINHDFFANTS